MRPTSASAGLLTLVAWMLLSQVEQPAAAISIGVPGVSVRETCNSQVVESIPIGYKLRFTGGQQPVSIYATLEKMINNAQKRIRIASEIIWLTPSKRDMDIAPKHVEPGQIIMQSLEEALKRGIKLEIVVGRKQLRSDLSRLEGAKVYFLDETKLPDALKYEMNSKFIIVDDGNFYIGSTDLVWTKFTMSKSLGLAFFECKSLAKDLIKIFYSYLLLAEHSSTGNEDILQLPGRLSTKLTLDNPRNITLIDESSSKGQSYKMFFSSSPHILANQTGRTEDLDSLLHVINSATTFIHISTPGFSASHSNTNKARKNYWPLILNALTKAVVERDVIVRFMVDSVQIQTGDQENWLKSLVALGYMGGNIHVRKLRVPDYTSATPNWLELAGSKGDNYVVTERGLWLGASNLVPGAFIRQAGTSMVIKSKSSFQNALLQRVGQIFLRDYSSSYSEERFENIKEQSTATSAGPKTKVGLMLIGALAENCQPEMVESMPDGMRSATFVSELRQTHEILIDMVESAKTSIKIASMYISLTDPKITDHPSLEPGRKLLESLVEATKRGVKLEIVVDQSGRPMSNMADLETLEEVATLYRLNMLRFTGKGNLHTKFMITDDESLYVGSANFDWRAYTQIKEIGVHFKGCPTMATDLDKIFQSYKIMSMNDREAWKSETLRTNINHETPFEVSVNNQKYKMYLTGAPQNVFNMTANGRTEDLKALLDVIDGAQKFINLSVMNYNVRYAFTRPKLYWPAIDNALRRAAIERKVRVNLLFSDWQNTREEEIIWYKSLNAIQPINLDAKYPPLGKSGGIYVKLFKVPAYDEFQEKIPFSRVKHDKYIVTDKALFISTSNLTPEYYENSCGVSLVFNRTEGPASGSSIIDDMQKTFIRDFESAEFARLV